MSTTNQKELNNQIDALHRKINITSSVRFRASFRLDQHDQVSKWMIPMLSAILIIIPLLQIAGIGFGVNQKLINVMEVFVSIVILILSVLISSSEFKLRAFKQHKCAMRLNKLAISMKINQANGNIDTEKLVELNKRYAIVLHEYESHKQVDYDKILTKGGILNYFKMRYREIPKDLKFHHYYEFYLLWIKAFFNYVLNFWLYIAVLVTTFYWMYLVFINLE